MKDLVWDKKVPYSTVIPQCSIEGLEKGVACRLPDLPEDHRLCVTCPRFSYHS
jgi:hypothetical protein